MSERNREVLEPLSRRESEVALLVRDGWTDKEIGTSLGVAESTVKSHLHSAYDKLGFNNRTTLAIWVERQQYAQGVHYGFLRAAVRELLHADNLLRVAVAAGREGDALRPYRYRAECALLNLKGAVGWVQPDPKPVLGEVVVHDE